MDRWLLCLLSLECQKITRSEQRHARRSAYVSLRASVRRSLIVFHRKSSGSSSLISQDGKEISKQLENSISSHLSFSGSSSLCALGGPNFDVSTGISRLSSMRINPGKQIARPLPHRKCHQTKHSRWRQQQIRTQSLIQVRSRRHWTMGILKHRHRNTASPPQLLYPKLQGKRRRDVKNRRKHQRWTLILRACCRVYRCRSET